MPNTDGQIILYQTEDGKIAVNVRFEDETFWMTQKAIAELFGVQVPAITKHLKNIFEEEELERESTVSKKEIVQTEGNREVARMVEFYNLDAIIAVGYRVNSRKATRFRQWATRTLHEYIQKGFILNDDMLKNGRTFGRDYFDELLERIREIRASERRAYQKIADVFEQCSYDYNKSSETTRAFYAFVQNKLHFAVTGKTAAELISDRVNLDHPTMGLTNWKAMPDGKIIKSDVAIAKNYLNENELSRLNRIVTMFIDYAELMAEDEVLMSMADWLAEADNFLANNRRRVLQGKGRISHDNAVKKAEEVYEQFRIRQDREYISQFDIEMGKYLKGNADAIISNAMESPSPAKIHKRSDPDEKIDLFISLFRGREDVYAKRWYNAKLEKAGYSPVCTNEWRQNVCEKPRVKCKDCSNSDFVPLSREAINLHLRNKDKNGVGIIGVYPLLPDETCYFLAVDFDKESWREDIAAFRTICENHRIPVSIERSRSGNGGHAWIFFEDAIPAVTARKLGSGLLTHAMSMRHQLRFTSYDRMFPNQDFMPKGGFGNLIALPLQGGARQNGNSEFVDAEFNSYDDQWAFLSSVRKLSLAEVESYIATLCKNGELGELASDSLEESVKPWERKKPDYTLSPLDFPRKLGIVSANMLYVEKDGVSQRALNKIKRLAAFKNPAFYKAQAMRLSTHDKQRIIFSLDETPEYLGIPRGCKNALLQLLDEVGISYHIEDKRNNGKPAKISFLGSLREEQALSANAILEHDTGVLCATTAFGKTVVGAYLIAQRKVNTLILVHTQALLAQWKKSLELFLAIDEVLPEQQNKRGRKKERPLIGQLGAGKNTLSGIVDVTVMQSLFEEDEVKELVKDYGMVIVDECHHVSAFSFEKILKKTDAKYVYGLTATPNRQDGHHPIIFMQCGEIRYRVDAKAQAEKRSFEHYIIPCFTAFKKPVSQDESNWTIAQIYSAICEDELRNRQIVQDVVTAVNSGRTPILLTERAAHVDKLSLMLAGYCNNVIALTGKASAKEKREAMERLAHVPRDEPLILVATGKYVGEGFDFARLDTLFLTMPVAWKGTVAQYAGRLHREYEGKDDVIIFDYVDVHVGVMEKMYHKRVKGYAQIGYKALAGKNTQEQIGMIYDTNSFASVMSADLETAAKEIVIVSPFMRRSRIMSILKWLLPATLKEAVITVVTRSVESFKEKDRDTVSACIDMLKSAGVNVIQKPNIHQKFTVIDRKIVWYGSINLLSYGSAEESVMRLESYELAAELLGIL